jgi:hypothetical protein
MMDLRLQRYALWPGALKALTNPPTPFAQLTELNLRYVGRMTVEDLEAVLQLRQVPLLTSLDLMGINRVQSLRFLASTPHLRDQLTYLSIEGDLPGWTVPVQDFFDHVVPLQGLTHLTLWNAIDLPKEIVKQLDSFVSGKEKQAMAAAPPAPAATPSLPLLPALRHFHFDIWSRPQLKAYAASNCPPQEETDEAEEEDQ